MKRNGKPAAIVSYSFHSGGKAAEQLANTGRPQDAPFKRDSNDRLIDIGGNFLATLRKCGLRCNS